MLISTQKSINNHLFLRNNQAKGNRCRNTKPAPDQLSHHKFLGYHFKSAAIGAAAAASSKASSICKLRLLRLPGTRLLEPDRRKEGRLVNEGRLVHELLCFLGMPGLRLVELLLVLVLALLLVPVLAPRPLPLFSCIKADIDLGLDRSGRDPRLRPPLLLWPLLRGTSSS